MPAHRIPVAERLRRHSRRDVATGCLIWTGGKMWKGYGRTKVDGRMKRVHRLAWEQVNGPIPAGMDCLHNCPGGDNRACIEIEHLWLGTNADNVADKIAKGRQSRKGPQGEAHPKAKVTNEQVLAIRNDWRPLRAIAREYGMHSRNVSAIRNRETWTHIP